MKRKPDRSRPAESQTTPLAPGIIASPTAIKESMPAKMPPSPPAPAKTGRERWLQSALAFGVLFVILWKWVNPALLTNVSFTYHVSDSIQGFPIFYFGADFARNVIFQPGGLSRYLANFLCQSYYLPWLGALVLTLVAAMADACFLGCLQTCKISKTRVLRAIPLLLMLGIWSTYLVYLGAIVNAVLGLVTAWVLTRLRVGNHEVRLGILICATAVLFAVAPSALLVFVPLVAFCEAVSGLRRAHLVVFVALAALVPAVVGRGCFGLDVKESFALMTPAGMTDLDLFDTRLALKGLGFKDTCQETALMLGGLYAIFALGGPVGAILQRLAARPKHRNLGKKQAAQSVARAQSRLDWKAESALLILALAATCFLAHSGEIKNFLAVEYYATAGMWDRVSQVAKGHENNPIIACAAAQAAYHTGRLRYEMPVMNYPSDLLLTGRDNWSFWRKTDLYYDLGYVNLGSHCAAEAMAMWDERPALLKRQALFYLAMGNMSSAKIYLNCLTKIPFQSTWANDYLSRLSADPTLDSDPEIARLRKSMAREDSVADLSVDKQLMLLLRANHSNRMAYEYIMTYYLLKKDLPSFLKGLSMANEFPGFEITPLWQEAVLIAARDMGKKVEPGKIGAETQRRFDEVLRIILASGQDKTLARSKLEPEYAKTYSFFYYFHD